MVEHVDVVVVGGGQAGLATAYHLRRGGLVPGRDVVVLDAEARPGGAWQHTWESLRLFSPAGYSSLPGWMMPRGDDTEGFPTRDRVVDYLTRYEQRYELGVRRPHRVSAVVGGGPDDRLLVRAQGLELAARHVVSTTGTWSQPFWPTYPGARDFRGRQLHAAQYRRAADLAGQRVVVVGGGNSGAQVLADLAEVADTTWVTTRPPRVLPDDVDGRALFAAATARVQAMREGREHAGVGGLGDVVVVDSVRRARERGHLRARPLFARLTAAGVAWSDGTELEVDAVVWCTGFRPALRHLRTLALHDRRGRVALDGTRVTAEPRLHLVGYGDWTGPASATLIGVGRSARDTAAGIIERLGR